MTRQPNRRTFMAAAGALTLGPVALLAMAQAEPRVIKLVAKKFEFVPEKIEIKRGEAVSLQISAPDVAMGFFLPDFKLRADIVPGRVTTLLLTPDKAGTFMFTCDVFCGSGHGDMGGALVVS